MKFLKVAALASVLASAIASTLLAQTTPPVNSTPEIIPIIMPREAIAGQITQINGENVTVSRRDNCLQETIRISSTDITRLELRIGTSISYLPSSDNTVTPRAIATTSFTTTDTLCTRVRLDFSVPFTSRNILRTRLTANPTPPSSSNSPRAPRALW